MHKCLKEAITPGTAVFVKARAAESSQRPCFHRRKDFVKHSSSDFFTLNHAKNANRAFPKGSAVYSRFPEQVRKMFRKDELSAFEQWGNTYPTEAAERLPSRIELDAVFASGRDHDYTRLKHLVAKLDRRVSELEAEAIEAKQRAIAAEDENTKLRSALESGVRSSLVPPPLGGSDDDGSQSANGSLLSLTGSNASYVSAKEDAIYVSVNKQRKKREGSKRRMSKQAKKATDLVQSGHVLTRAGISALTKAEARAYLSAIKGSSGRGNRSELLDAIRSMFDDKEIDVLCGRTFSPPLCIGASLI